MLTLRGAKLYR